MIGTGGEKESKRIQIKRKICYTFIARCIHKSSLECYDRYMFCLQSRVFDQINAADLP